MRMAADKNDLKENGLRHAQVVAIGNGGGYTRLIHLSFLTHANLNPTFKLCKSLRNTANTSFNNRELNDELLEAYCEELKIIL